MWRAWILSAFAAAVASLAAAGPAVAGEPVQSASATATSGASENAASLSLLGFNICVGDRSLARRCHVTLPALPHPQPPPPQPAKRLTVMGKTLCFGGAPKQAGCDWQLPQQQTHG
jgi:hypothetical protein